MSRPNFDRLALPPRLLPLTLRLFALFGEPLGQLGWFVLGFGSIFFWIFGAQADWTSPLVFAVNSVQSADGRVMRVTDTGAKEGGSQVRAVEWSARVSGGPYLEGTSFVTGFAPHVGASVTIEYLEHWPGVARVQGMRRAMFGPGALITLLFPGVGVAMVVVSLRWGLARVRLLALGKTAAAAFKSRAETNTRVNGRPLIRLTFEFAGDDGRRHEVTQGTTSPGVLTDEARETVLYLPADPSKATMVDRLSDSIEADESGNLRVARPSLAWWALLLPLLVTLANGACTVARWSH